MSDGATERQGDKGTGDKGTRGQRDEGRERQATERVSEKRAATASHNVSGSVIEEAARFLRQGKLVAFPTETVYGLGANALDAKAVARIYAVKGRPATSPIIVHMHSLEMARNMVEKWPSQATLLADRFWPGPLTIVLMRHPKMPEIVSAGLPTVGVRVPAHPVALAIIRSAGVPVAAPSANRFSQLSPTTAEHVREGLGDAVDLIVDGGPTDVGIESTVISLAARKPVLLRPGMITRHAIEQVIGPVEDAVEAPEQGASHPAPGMHRRHYSPRTRLVLLDGSGKLPRGKGAYLRLQTDRTAARVVSMPRDPAGYAAVLYETLHALDREGWDWIVVERPPDEAAWEGIADRLGRAATE